MAKKFTHIQNKTAIREVIGCLLQEPALIRQYKMTVNDFPEPFHRLLFGVINNLYRSGAGEINSGTVETFLLGTDAQLRLYNKYDGNSYLDRAADLSSLNNFKYNYDLLKKYSLLRRFAESGVDISEFYDDKEVLPDKIAAKREYFESLALQDIINHFKKKQLEVIAPFLSTEGRDSKKAGVGGHEQKEKWKEATAWGLGYASAYLTTALHGIRKRRFNVKSAGTGVGKILFI